MSVTGPHRVPADGSWVEPELFVSTEAIECRLEAVESHCEASVDIMVKGTSVLDTADASEERALRRGVTVRCLYERSVQLTPEGRNYLARWRAKGEQQRFVDRVPFRGAVVDRTLALVPLGAEGSQMTSLLVVRAELAEYLVSLFELLWTGRPLAPRKIPSLSSEEESLLALLCEGASDHAIGRALGLSIRTVQRRIQRLEKLFAAGSRSALAARAVAAGVVAPFGSDGGVSLGVVGRSQGRFGIDPPPPRS